MDNKYDYKYEYIINKPLSIKDLEHMINKPIYDKKRKRWFILKYISYFDYCDYSKHCILYLTENEEVFYECNTFYCHEID